MISFRGCLVPFLDDVKCLHRVGLCQSHSSLASFMVLLMNDRAGCEGRKTEKRHLIHGTATRSGVSMKLWTVDTSHAVTILRYLLPLFEMEQGERYSIGPALSCTEG